MAPLVVENVTKTFRQGDREVIALGGGTGGAAGGVSLSIERGRFVAIMGASGSGKSTLLHLMAGLTKPDSGRVVVANQNLVEMNDRALTLFRRKHIGLVFQAFNLIPTLTAEENVMLPLMLEGRNGQVAATRVTSLIETLGLGARRHHRPDALSGGEQQRVAIGRALVSDPDVILADEPTGNLDSASSRSVCELLRELCRRDGRTIVMVTHEPSVATFAQEVAVIKDGKLVDRFSTIGLQDSHQLALRYQDALS
jgi:putative ABC transport system ATP-binding protein